MTTSTAPPCRTGPTCRIPKDIRRTYTCPHCSRLWLERDNGHGRYWLHKPKH